MAKTCHETKIFRIRKKHFFCRRNEKISFVLAVVFNANPAITLKLTQSSTQLWFTIGERMINLFQGSLFARTRTL